MADMDSAQKATGGRSAFALLGWLLFLLTFPACYVLTRNLNATDKQPPPTSPSAYYGIDSSCTPEKVQDGLRLMGLIVAATKDPPQTNYAPLKGVKKFKLTVNLSEALKKHCDPQELRSKFELKLRNNGVCIADDSKAEIVLCLDGRTSDDDPVMVYFASINVYDNVFLIRPDGIQMPLCNIWKTSSLLGKFDKQISKRRTIAASELMSELFINDWLAANPK